MAARSGTHFSKPGSTQKQRNKDNLECKREATPAQNKNGMFLRTLDYNKYHNCLRARGYTKTKD
jgi:hypothetical protein